MGACSCLHTRVIFGILLLVEALSVVTGETRARHKAHKQPVPGDFPTFMTSGIPLPSQRMVTEERTALRHTSQQLPQHHPHRYPHLLLLLLLFASLSPTSAPCQAPCPGIRN